MSQGLAEDDSPNRVFHEVRGCTTAREVSERGVVLVRETGSELAICRQAKAVAATAEMFGKWGDESNSKSAG